MVEREMDRGKELNLGREIWREGAERWRGERDTERKRS